MSHKTLYLLRHAKARSGTVDMDDHERPLADRGEREALQMGAWMRGRGIAPQRVLCSTALRTRETLSGVEEGLGQKLPAEITPRLYNTTPAQIVTLLAELAPDVASAMIVGHNPTLHQLAIELAGEGERSVLDDLLRQFPPASFVALEFAAGWDQIAPRAGRLVEFVVPKQLEMA